MELTSPSKAAAEEAKATRRAIDFIIVVEGWWLVVVVAVCVRGLGVEKVSQVSVYVCVCAAGYLDCVRPNPTQATIVRRVGTSRRAVEGGLATTKGWLATKKCQR